MDSERSRSPVPASASGLAVAIVLIERPPVGVGAARERARLPKRVVTDARVDDRIVRCSVAAEVVSTLAGARGAPTWGDLQAQWPTIAALLRTRIRMGALTAAETTGEAWTVTLDGDDLARLLPAASVFDGAQLRQGQNQLPRTR